MNIGMKKFMYISQIIYLTIYYIYIFIHTNVIRLNAHIYIYNMCVCLIYHEFARLRVNIRLQIYSIYIVTTVELCPFKCYTSESHPEFKKCSDGIRVSSDGFQM